jgi:hypothetical protein
MICCFSGGESNFSIVEDNRGKNVRFNFRFIIGLHIDDKPLLKFIKKEIGCGSIINNKDNTASYLTIGDKCRATAATEIKNKLIPIPRPPFRYSAWPL